GIILAYLGKTGRSALNRYVYVGLGLAVAASLGVAVVFQAIGFDPENEIMEGTMLGVGGVFVASMVLWMARTAKNIKKAMESRLENIVGQDMGTTMGLGLLAFTFIMVFREGVETVIFLAALTQEEAGALQLLGAVVGLGIACLFAILFVRGSLRINLGRFFGVTGLVLLILAAKLLAGSVHEFAEIGAIPMRKEIMSILGYFVRDNTSTAIMTALVVLPIFMVLWDLGRRETAPTARSAAERRKQEAAALGERAWRLSLAGSAVLVAALMATAVFAGQGTLDPTPVPLEAANGDVAVAFSDLQEGQLHKFATRIDGTDVRFLVAKGKQGELYTAFDACEICGAVGYLQEGDKAICKNCNAPIPWDTLGQGGGCNPIRLEADSNDTHLVVHLEHLKAELARFQ
ncbi:MAG: Fe-S-containing protein, partial [Dehalococcoidia bacterium]|nr:Fe-S-containing protein [Dehalococcoidia bacterium]